MKKKLSASEVLNYSPVIAVLTIREIKHAIPVAAALRAGGIKVLEITLRTEAALASMQKIVKEFPDLIVGAGTVINPEGLQQVVSAGAKFAISPGISQSLLDAGKLASIPLIPGIATVSELMLGVNSAYSSFKFFPAEAMGGVKTLRSFYGPFDQVKFCPTGGISVSNYQQYLALPNVTCVGGTWITPSALMQAEDWNGIESLAAAAGRIKP